MSKPLSLFVFCLLLLISVGANAQQRDSSAEVQSERAQLGDEQSGAEFYAKNHHNNDDYLSNKYDASDEDYADQDYLSDDYQEVLRSPNFTLESGQELPRSDSSKKVHAEIKKVLASDDFAHMEKVTRRRFIDLLKQNEEQLLEEDKIPEWIIDIARKIERFRDAVGGLAKLVEIMIWTLGIGIIIFIIIRYRSEINTWASDIRASEVEPELPTTLFGLPIRKDSIPDDVVQRAQSYWQRGDQRQAVATLLQSSLVKLLHEHGCRFFSSDTESECCDQIEQQASVVISAYMQTLVSVWQGIAYAHIQPSKDQFELLCRQWREVF